MWSIAAYMVICMVSSLFRVEDGPTFRNIWYIYNCLMSIGSGIFSIVGFCSLVSATSDTQITSLWVASKYLEWADTVFLTLADKPIQVLHYWHHGTTVVLFSLAAMDDVMNNLGMLLNGWVHCVMYMHYANPLPWRYARFITCGQIAQFVLILLYYITHLDRFGSNDKSTVAASLVLSYLILFIHYFYTRRF